MFESDSKRKAIRRSGIDPDRFYAVKGAAEQAYRRRRELERPEREINKIVESWSDDSVGRDVEVRTVESVVEAGGADQPCDLCGSTYNTGLRITYNFGILRLCPRHPCEAEFTEEERVLLYRRMLQ